MNKPSTLAEAFGEICKMDAPLNERLAAYANALRDLNFPFAEAYDDLVARLKAGGIGAMAPLSRGDDAAVPAAGVIHTAS